MRSKRSRRLVLTTATVAALSAGALTIATANQAQAEDGCEVEYKVVSSWGGGFQANVSITAAEPINGWDLTWDFPAGTQVTSAWNVDWDQNGTEFTGADVGWNAAVGAGQTREVFGFIGSGSTAAPQAIKVNGDLCDGQVDPTGGPTDPTETPTEEPPGEAVRIMPLGDSITGSPGCWRGNLWDLLDEAGHEVDFVGSLSQACNPAGSDPDHEGHGGFQVTQSVANGSVRGWLEQHTPDVLMMHFATNDVWSNLPPSQILAAYTQIVADLRELNPDAVILVAQIIPLHPDPSFGCTDCPQRAIDFNAAIPAWAAGLTTAESPIIVVDQWTGFDPAVDTYDGVHPDEDGYVKIAANWFEALDQVLS
ncbi:cellulose binding domain-containing protein [Glycomyces tritici]|uniref:Cellulose binding domain-containing protein n=1 Tax=Glycomyces tritici TaxID=2665176 RepID=A0ABT7YV04_9ACTN|nr:cellulose binding domain-containing protein [Glycomyces tritici]MDN3242466.1 cellulose binding domain-containing protein [Glycomyces tritici]